MSDKYKVKLDLDRLHELMAIRGMDLSDVANQTQISYAHMRRIAIGDRPNVSAVMLGKIARALQTSVDYLVGLTDSPAPYGAQGVREDLRPLISALAGLPPSRLRDIYEIVESLKRVDANEQSLRAEGIAMEQMLDFIEKRWGLEAAQDFMDKIAAPYGLGSSDVRDRLRDEGWRLDGFIGESPHDVGEREE
jgi:transcriptional regulator with XRE-family HTH domain